MNYCVNYVLKKQKRIVFLVKKRGAWYLTRNEKFGIVLPKTVEGAHHLDKKNGNTM